MDVSQTNTKYSSGQSCKNWWKLNKVLCVRVKVPKFSFSKKIAQRIEESTQNLRIVVRVKISSHSPVPSTRPSDENENQFLDRVSTKPVSAGNKSSKLTTVLTSELTAELALRSNERSTRVSNPPHGQLVTKSQNLECHYCSTSESTERNTDQVYSRGKMEENRFQDQGTIFERESTSIHSIGSSNKPETKSEHFKPEYQLVRK